MPFAGQGRRRRHRRRRRAAVAVCALAASLAVAGCGASGTSNGTSAINYVIGKGVLTTFAVGHRKAAPVVSGADLDGTSLSLKQYAGDVVVLNFWGSWCPPCRAEAPVLEQVFTDTRSSGVQFVGVDVREPASAARTFDSEHGVSYPSLYDSSGKITLAFRGNGVSPVAQPSTLIIDRQGRVAALGSGEMQFDQLESAVKAIAAES